MHGGRTTQQAPAGSGTNKKQMFDSHYEAAFDVLNGIAPWGKEIYSIPMQLLTPKFVGKLPADAVYLAKVDEVLECQMVGNLERYLLKFGDCTFEGFGKSGVMPVMNKPDVACFTPRVVFSNMQEREYVVLDVIGFNSVPTTNTFVGDDYDGTDPSDLARQAQDLAYATEAHDAMT